LQETDIAFVQRGLYPLGPGLVGGVLERFPGRVVLDLDDSVFGLKPDLASGGPIRRWLYDQKQARSILRRADAVIVSTEELASQVRGYCAEVTILPTVPDAARYPTVEHSSAKRVRVGWAGTSGNLRYLDPLRELFMRLAGEHVAELEVVSSEPWTGPSTFRVWQLMEEAKVFGRFAIGIMPLPDGEYTRAKAGFKLLQYMAAGVPVVASPVGVNRELVEQSRSGFLASSTAEWEDALRRLAGDPDLRQTLGRNGRAFVERYADLEGQARTLARVLRG
jgi:glycosyltransferase involved in cell wall biosynthesis